MQREPAPLKLRECCCGADISLLQSLSMPLFRK
jgi:hypothetical protein